MNYLSVFYFKEIIVIIVYCAERGFYYLVKFYSLWKVCFVIVALFYTNDGRSGI